MTAGVFTTSIKDLALVIPPGDWVRLDIDVGAWLPDGYALLTVQLYAESWADFEAPSDIRTRLQREQPGAPLDYTAESVHPVADDWALDRTTMMYVRQDTPVAVTIRVKQAPVTLHTVIYRGVAIPSLEAAGDPGVQWDRDAAALLGARPAA